MFSVSSAQWQGRMLWRHLRMSESKYFHHLRQDKFNWRHPYIVCDLGVDGLCGKGSSGPCRLFRKMWKKFALIWVCRSTGAGLSSVKIWCCSNERHWVKYGIGTVEHFGCWGMDLLGRLSEMLRTGCVLASIMVGSIPDCYSDYLWGICVAGTGSDIGGD